MDGQSQRIERELHIAAAPDLVFRYLTDADKLTQWMGRAATLDARPGGTLRIDYNGFDIMRGSFLEVVPPTRVVFTWGWETLGDGLRPGASTVEFDLTQDGLGTRLRMVHSGLPGGDEQSHAEGWDHFLGALAAVVAGGQPNAHPVLTRSEEHASLLNALLVAARDFVERSSEEAWRAPTSAGDPRTVGAVAAHLVGHLGLVAFANSVALGERSPLADLTANGIEAMNAEAAREQAGISREDVIASLQSEGQKAVAVLRGLTDEQLGKRQAMVFAGGAELTAEQLILGALLADIQGHLDAIRQVAR